MENRCADPRLIVRKNDVDGFGQLERRLSVVAEMQTREICLSEFRHDLDGYWPVEGSSRTNPYSSYARGLAPSSCANALYKELLDTVSHLTA